MTLLLPAEAEPSITQAAEIIRRGGIVAYPTDTLYGLGAHCWQPRAIESVFTAKGRRPDQPVPLLLAKAEDTLELAEDLPVGFWRLAREFWPGPLTIVLRKKPTVPAEISAGSTTVALRIPRHSVALALIQKVGAPITGTSANRSGQPSPRTAQDVLSQLDGGIDAVLDGGACPGGVESTILDLSSGRPRILRKGALDIDDLRDVLETAIDS